jgi:hypothetical protein
MNSQIETENSSDLAAVFAAIEKINHRLDRLEANPPSPNRNPQLAHPSLDKLNIVESIVDSLFKEKACQFEPDKPCDHCSMCNSRGF